MYNVAMGSTHWLELLSIKSIVFSNKIFLYLRKQLQSVCIHYVIMSSSLVLYSIKYLYFHHLHVILLYFDGFICFKICYELIINFLFFCAFSNQSSNFLFSNHLVEQLCHSSSMFAFCTLIHVFLKISFIATMEIVCLCLTRLLIWIYFVTSLSR